MSFYVYELIDPTTRAAFYVGKGKNRRLHNHEAEASKGVHSRKCDRIRKIWSLGLEVEKRIVSTHTDENEALQAEFDLIAEYGLNNLTNVLPGGVIGPQVYLAHLAGAHARNEAKEKEGLAKSFESIAPQIAMVLRAKARGGQVGAWVGERWLDFTEAFDALFVSMLKSHGFEFVAGVLAPHGVHLQEK